MTLWKARFSGETSDVLKHLNDSLHIDIRLFPYDAQVNAAWAEELKEVGILNDDELTKIKKALASLVQEYFAGAYTQLPNDEDVHSLVERRLTEIAGDAGRKIHTGKSRNDQVVTDLKMYLRDITDELGKKLKDLVRLLVDSAEQNVGTLMPGYTHLQQAQPINLAQYILSFAHSLWEDHQRLERYQNANLNSCPLGSGALAGTTLDIDRGRLSKRLGFEKPTDNSMQSTSDRAFVIELAAVLAITAMHLSRQAEDLIIWNSKEFSFIELSDAVSTGSSMMPQKKNPDSLELLRAVTGTTYGNLIGLLTITKGVPLSYAKDLQDDKKFIFESIDLLLSSLDLFAEVLTGLKFNKKRMASAIDQDVLATDLADILVKRRIPFRKAHEEVASLAKTAAQAKKKLKDFSSQELSKISPNITLKDIKSLSLASSVEKRAASGGTAPSSVKAQIKNLKKHIQ